jgi:hypothetical protein
MTHRIKTSIKAIFLVCVAATLAAALASCAVLGGALGSFDPLAGAKASAEKRANAEIASASGLTGMTRKMMFNMIYAQVFFIGGFNPDIFDLAETQGCAWRLESKDKDDKESSVVESERAFLKKNADGTSWWYLSWKTEDEEWAFEALMDSGMMAKKIRYYNADVKRIEEAVFEESADQKASKGTKADKAAQEEKAPPPESPSSDMTVKDLARYSKGKEKVSVGAGSYQADKLVWELKDEESGKKATYTWWVDAKAPGGLVKFVWSGSDGDSLKGELSSMKKGYTTKFKSF